MGNEDIEVNDEPRLGQPRLTRLDPEADSAVVKIAETEDRPIAQVIRHLVREALAARGKRRAA